MARAVGQLTQTLERAHAEAPHVVLGAVDQQVVVDVIPLAEAHGSRDLAERLRAIGIERIGFDRGVVDDELFAFVRGIAAAHSRTED